MHNYTFLKASTAYKIDIEPTSTDSQVYLKGGNQRALVQETAEVSSSTANPIYESDIVYNSLLIIPLIGWCALITSLLVAFFRSEKLVQPSMLQRVKQDCSDLKLKQSIPCARCRYFSANTYVRCAVHPSKALTVQAVDCTDYHS